MAVEHLREEGIHYPHTEVGVQLPALTQELPDFPQEASLLSLKTVKHGNAGKKKTKHHKKQKTTKQTHQQKTPTKQKTMGKLAKNKQT